MKDVYWIKGHWPHLATKPALSGALLLGAHLVGLPLALGASLAFVLPMGWSTVRKALIWPGTLDRWGPAWRDVVADSVATGIPVVGVVWGWPWALVPVAVLVLGLHRWALP